VTVRVTDAGDPISGANVTIKGHHKTTNKHDVAKLTVSGSPRGRVTLTIRVPGYRVMKMKVIHEGPGDVKGWCAGR
jgi:hypothetical protein